MARDMESFPTFYKDGLPILMNHDHEYIMGRAIVEFGKDPYSATMTLRIINADAERLVEYMTEDLVAISFVMIQKDH